jgi:hypothetical protein
VEQELGLTNKPGYNSYDYKNWNMSYRFFCDIFSRNFLGNSSMVICVEVMNSFSLM